jgi:hypothetical protein
MAHAHIDQELQRIHKQLLRGPEKWIHHVADLDQKGSVRSSESARPISTADRLKQLDEVIKIKAPVPIFDLTERTLTAQAPYLASPLSYLDALGRSWSLAAENNSLEWAEFGAPDARYGGIEFWFRNVAAGSTNLVSIAVTAGATGQGVTGNLQVRSSAGPAQTFQFTGFADQILDVVARPTEEFAVLVVLEAGAGVGYLAFHEITYLTL